MNMPEADFMSDFKKFLDNHVDCRLKAMLTEDHRTANHEDRTAELESRTDNLESQGRDHEDRLDSQTNASTLLAEELWKEIEKLENKVEELESQIEYYSDHEDRINNLEEQLESVDRSQLIKDATAIIDRRIHELASRGQLRIYVASTEGE